jgi:hypothetical protein
VIGTAVRDALQKRQALAIATLWIQLIVFPAAFTLQSGDRNRTRSG